MFVFIAVFMASVLLVVLTYKYVGLDRGVDPRHIADARERVEPPSEPPFEKLGGASEVQEQMENLQQVFVPVQYIDNGLLPRIQKSLPEVMPKHREEYGGPAPFSGFTKNFRTDSFQNARFQGGLSPAPDFKVPTPTPEEVEPFNSFEGMIVSEHQDVARVGS